LNNKAIAVMACDDDVLPLQERVETVADEAELDEVFETESHLFYVACTRARDQLLVSGVSPASEFFADLSSVGAHENNFCVSICALTTYCASSRRAIFGRQ
jgi:ATP-dependent exoDNAse (exonuclease V) beta subunit